MGDVGESRCLEKLIDLGQGGIPLDHAKENVCKAESLLLRLSDYKIQHDIRGRLRDRAPVPDIPSVSDPPVLQAELQDDVISAARIDSLELDRTPVNFMLMNRMQVVVRYDLLIKTILHIPSSSELPKVNK